MLSSNGNQSNQGQHQQENQAMALDEQTANPDLTELAAEIVSAYVSHNSVQVSDLPKLIGEVHRALTSSQAGVVEPKQEPLMPAVNPKRSVFPDYIVCLEDGKKFKSLRRHLRTTYALSPEQYREKWGLAHDYPMVAPNYSKARSELAVKMGLGQGRRRK
jgi:MucR family transcriptional regulator, transcriptional regulator of exopolysaccharide biosynthesis